MSTITVQEYQDYDPESDDAEAYVARVFEDVVNFQVGTNMLQMVFPDGSSKVLTGFMELDIQPTEDEKVRNLSHYEESMRPTTEEHPPEAVSPTPLKSV